MTVEYVIYSESENSIHTCDDYLLMVGAVEYLPQVLDSLKADPCFDDIYDAFNRSGITCYAGKTTSPFPISVNGNFEEDMANWKEDTFTSLRGYLEDCFISGSPTERYFIIGFFYDRDDDFVNVMSKFKHNKYALPCWGK